MKLSQNNTIKILGLALVLTLTFGFAGSVEAASANNLVQLANSSRTQNGLAKLVVSDKLTRAALVKAQDMVKNNYFAHISPTGETPWDFIKSQNYNYSFAGENLSIGYNDDKELHNAWMDSPSHRANIMNPDFREIGIAVLEGQYNGADTIFVVQMFGSTFMINNSSRVQSSQISQTKIPVKFDLIENETDFSPKNIFAGESMKIKITITGEVEKMTVNIGNSKNNILDSTAVRIWQDKKIYEKDIELNEAGNFSVNLTLVDKDGNTKVSSLGQIKVESKTITKTAATLSQGKIIGNYIILFGLIFLAIGSVYFAYRRTKPVHNRV